jgi:small-conductance mechanosensitive channel
MLFTSAATAQNSTPTAAQTEHTEATVLAERDALAKEIAEARRALEAADDDTREHAEREAALLEKIDLLYSQQLTALHQATDLAQEKKAVDKALKKLRRDGAGKPPFSVLALDEVRAELKDELQRETGLTANVQAAQDAVAAARAAADDSARRRRETKEELRTNVDPAERSGLERKLKLRTLAARVDVEEADLVELQLANEKTTRDIRNLRETLLRERAEELERGVEFSETALEEQLKKLDEQEAQLKSDLKAAKRKLAESESNWARAKRELDATAEPDSALVEEAEARRMELNTNQLAVSLLEQRLHRIGGLRDAWRHRHAVVTGKAERAKMREWSEETGRAVDQLRRDNRVYRARVREITEAKRTPGSERTEELSEAARRWMRAQKQQLDARRDLYEAALETAAADLGVQEAFAKDVDARLQQVPLRERLQGFVNVAASIWNYELLSVDDEPITVAKVVVGLVFFLLGVLFASYTSRQLGKRVFPRLRLEQGSAAALQSAAYYFLIVLVLVAALRVVNVPLTAFTLLGGAFAIGIGFGSQNVVNNFISGLILLIEQPVRPGDVTEVDGTHGVVERIGLRSTRIRSSANIDIIVPNSTFLEKNVINWTLTDDRIRTSVSVGVTYGSRTDEVTRLIRKVVDEHERILEVPAPVILFTEFGDNALIFEVHFWMRMRQMMDRRIVESDVRYRINDLFTATGISIAFPQRDIHLDSTKPFEVRIVAPDDVAKPKREAEGGD